MLSSEYEYALSFSGESYVSKDTHYYEDDSKDTSEYDENWNTLCSCSYAAGGSWMGEKMYEGDQPAEEMEFLFGSGEDGSWSMSGKTTTYHEDGF